MDSTSERQVDTGAETMDDAALAAERAKRQRAKLKREEDAEWDACCTYHAERAARAELSPLAHLVGALDSEAAAERIKAVAVQQEYEPDGFNFGRLLGRLEAFTVAAIYAERALLDERRADVGASAAASALEEAGAPIPTTEAPERVMWHVVRGALEALVRQLEREGDADQAQTTRLALQVFEGDIPF